MKHKYYIDPQGVRYANAPLRVVIGDRQYIPATESRLVEAGWQVMEEEVQDTIEEPAIYSEIVVSLIRERYSINDELAILRQRDSKADEFAAYNDYCEECKSRARKEVGV